MTRQRTILHQISWRDVCPWFVIFRAFRVATSLQVLFLATIATLLTPIGWQAGQLLLTEKDKGTLGFDEVRAAAAWSGFAAAPSSSSDSRSPWETSSNSVVDVVTSRVSDATYRMENVYHELSRPFRALFNPYITITRFGYFLCGGLWTLAVWGLFGGAITRIAVLRLGRDERVSLKDSLGLTLQRYVSYLMGPLALLLVVVVIALVMSPVGLLMRTDFGLVATGIVWGVVLSVGFLLTLVFFGLLFGWPLMWPTISAENQGDAFEAVQRSFSYTYERPVHYLLYAMLAMLVGGLGWIAVDLFFDAVISSSMWVVGYGAGAARMREIGVWLSGTSTDSHSGAACIWFWVSLIRTIKIAYGFAFFWTATSAIYLLLRQHVDETEHDEIYVPGEELRYDLPTLQHTEASPPQVVSDDPT